MLVPKKPMPVAARLHDLLSMENSSLWCDNLAAEFDVLVDEEICGDEQMSPEIGDIDEDTDLEAMVVLLPKGLPDGAE